jgi:hypothetical protein
LREIPATDRRRSFVVWIRARIVHDKMGLLFTVTAFSFLTAVTRKADEGNPLVCSLEPIRDFVIDL